MSEPTITGKGYVKREEFKLFANVATRSLERSMKHEDSNWINHPN